MTRDGGATTRVPTRTVTPTYTVSIKRLCHLTQGTSDLCPSGLTPSFSSVYRTPPRRTPPLPKLVERELKTDTGVGTTGTGRKVDGHGG